RHGAERGRDGSVQLVERHVELLQRLLEVGNLAGEAVVLEEENLEPREVAQRGWDGARQVVPADGEADEALEREERPRELAGEPVPVEEHVAERRGGGEVARERAGERVEAEAERVQRRQVPERPLGHPPRQRRPGEPQ
ncbi:Os03g0712500, partial [Oryza sativa Japonica Group]